MNRALKRIAKELSKLGDVLGVILYGSLARGEATLRSDIDLLILVINRKAITKVEEEVIRIEKLTGKTIQPTIRVLDTFKKTDSGLIQNIFQEGKILYLKEPMELSSSLLLEQKPCLIYTFKMNNLSQNIKAKFNNDFYRRTKGKYHYEGLLKEIGGMKLSPGCVFVPYAEKQKIEKFFKKFKIIFNSLKIWK